MKKILVVVVLMASVLLVGCSQDTKVLEDVEYVSQVDVNGTGTLLIFLHGEEEVAFKANDGKYFLIKGNKYNVEYSIEDFWRWGDSIKSIEESQ